MEENKNTQEAPKAEAAKNPEEKGWFARNWPWVTAVGTVLLAAGGAALVIFGGDAGDAAVQA